MNADEALFVKLVKEHHGIINAICLVYYKNSEDRQDAKQDTLIQLWKALPSFRHESKITTWIYRVCLNTILARRRDQKREVTALELTEVHHHYWSTSPFADDDVQSLKLIIEMLPDTEKAMVILHLEGYSHKEIGTILSISETNVGTRLNRLRQRIKKIYQSHHHEHRSL